jgi:hypothetical protein
MATKKGKGEGKNGSADSGTTAGTKDDASANANNSGNGGNGGSGNGGSTIKFPDFTAAKQALIGDFSPSNYCYLAQTNSFILMDTGAQWSATGIDNFFPLMVVTVTNNDGTTEEKKIPPSEWIIRHNPVAYVTWDPGSPQIIEDKLLHEKGGWIEKIGARGYNKYRASPDLPGEAKKAGPWVDHVKKLYPSDFEHIFDWLASLVQFPGIKCNHTLVLGGNQGTGKDTLLRPVRAVIGEWNWGECSPTGAMGRFNPFLMNRALRINEGRDLGDHKNYQFFERLKGYQASPPETLPIDEKYLPVFPIINCVGIIITTNNKIMGLFLLEDDRRHYVAWSELTVNDFPAGYWDKLNTFLDKEGGIGHVGAFLRARDLSKFDPKAPPLKTAAFWDIVNANRPVLQALIEDRIDSLARAAAVAEGAKLEEDEQLSEEQARRLLPAVTLDMLKGEDTDGVNTTLHNWLADFKNKKLAAHYLEQIGFTSVRNDDTTHNLWIIAQRRHAIYARKELTPD